jgi:hypothetical protein
MLTYADVCSMQVLWLRSPLVITNHLSRSLQVMFAGSAGGDGPTMAGMRSILNVCSTYAQRMRTYADVCSRMLTHAGRARTIVEPASSICWRMLTYADVC